MSVLYVVSINTVDDERGTAVLQYEVTAELAAELRAQLGEPFQEIYIPPPSEASMDSTLQGLGVVVID